MPKPARTDGSFLKLFSDNCVPQAGQCLLAQYVFIHLGTSKDPAPGDKLGLLLAMLHKLYGLVAGAVAEDNPDALTHHEILLPGAHSCAVPGLCRACGTLGGCVSDGEAGGRQARGQGSCVPLQSTPVCAPGT